jgi:hypothetical protein
MKRTLLTASICTALAACAEVYPPPPPPPPPQAEAPFRAADFAWSTDRGGASIQGSVQFGHGFSCAGQPVVLNPDAPYSRARIVQLYGSPDRATLPVSQVRARQANRPSDEYSAFVRRTTCDAQGHFAFQGLPPGGWYVIAVVQPGAGQGEAMALMRRVDTRPGQVRSLVMD